MEYQILTLEDQNKADKKYIFFFSKILIFKINLQFTVPLNLCDKSDRLSHDELRAVL